MEVATLARHRHSPAVPAPLTIGLPGAPSLVLLDLVACVSVRCSWAGGCGALNGRIRCGRGGKPERGDFVCGHCYSARLLLFQMLCNVAGLFKHRVGVSAPCLLFSLLAFPSQRRYCCSLKHHLLPCAAAPFPSVACSAAACLQHYSTMHAAEHRLNGGIHSVWQNPFSLYTAFRQPPRVAMTVTLNLFRRVRNVLFLA